LLITSLSLPPGVGRHAFDLHEVGIELPHQEFPAAGAALSGNRSFRIRLELPSRCERQFRPR
jgi:hypothetical protein